MLSPCLCVSKCVYSQNVWSLNVRLIVYFTPLYNKTYFEWKFLHFTPLRRWNFVINSHRQPLTTTQKIHFTKLRFYLWKVKCKAIKRCTKKWNEKKWKHFVTRKKLWFKHFINNETVSPLIQKRVVNSQAKHLCSFHTF